MLKIYLAFAASLPRGRWRCASARQLSASTRNLEEKFKVPRGYGHVGELDVLRSTSHAQGPNPLEGLIKGTSDTRLSYIILSFSIQWNDQVYQYCTALFRLRNKDSLHPKRAKGATISRLL